MSDGLLGILFVLAAGLSLATSWVLVSRLERVGARLGLSEALLGMLAALAADAPEITSAITAMIGHQSRIGAGVVIGSNVFNLAALLGLAAVVAGGIAMHRRVVVMEGIVAILIAVLCLIAVLGLVSAGVALAASAVVLVPYLIVLGVPHDRLRRLGLPAPWSAWLAEAVVEEEIELAPALHPRRARFSDEITAGAAVLGVVGASVVMEQTGSRLGARYHVAEIVIGALLLAIVTSLPNAVAALYLAARGRGAATLSTALNSNALNVTIGLLLPGAIVGLGAPSGEATLVAASYLGLTVVALACAYAAGGLRRGHGALIIGIYLAFVAALLASS